MLAVFVTLSGTFTISTINDLLYQLIFLPITVFLVISAINTFLYRGSFALPDLVTNTGKANLVVALLIFAIFFVIGVNRVVNNKNLTGDTNVYSKGIKVAVNTPTPLPSPETDISTEKLVTVTADDPKTVINLRRDADNNSPILTQVKSGEVYEIIESIDGWVKIKFSEDISGWIADKYILKQ
jgi:hypothetical protein